MSKLIVELSEELHGRLKRQAAAERTTLKVIVTTLLGQYLHTGHRPAAKHATGLCGAWKDRRGAEELIHDIHSARRWALRERG